MQPMPSDLNAFAHACHLASAAKGWEPEKRTDVEQVNLIVSECSEALEEFRAHRGLNEVYYNPGCGLKHELWEKPDCKCKPCGIPIELADIVIRIAQHCGTHQLQNDAHSKGFDLDIPCYTPVAGDFQTSLATVTYIVSCTLHNPYSQNIWLLQGIRIVHGFCQREGIDLWHWVDIKMAYNATRPHRHGGKAL